LTELFKNKNSEVVDFFFPEYKPLIWWYSRTA